MDTTIPLNSQDNQTLKNNTTVNSLSTIQNLVDSIVVDATVDGTNSLHKITNLKRDNFTAETTALPISEAEQPSDTCSIHNAPVVESSVDTPMVDISSTADITIIKQGKTKVDTTELPTSKAIRKPDTSVAGHALSDHPFCNNHLVDGHEAEIFSVAETRLSISTNVNGPAANGPALGNPVTDDFDNSDSSNFFLPVNRAPVRAAAAVEHNTDGSTNSSLADPRTPSVSSPVTRTATSITPLTPTLSLKRPLATVSTPSAKRTLLSSSPSVNGSTKRTPVARRKTNNASIANNSYAGPDVNLTNHPYRHKLGDYLPGPNPLAPVLRLGEDIKIFRLSKTMNTMNNQLRSDPDAAAAATVSPVTSFIPITCCQSDGEKTSIRKGSVFPVPNAPVIDQQHVAPKDGKVVFYYPCREDSDQAISWRKSLGKDMADACDAHKPTEFILDGFPEDYVLWEKITGRVDANNTLTHIDRSDKYLYGYKNGKRFASPQEFFPHLLWLGTDTKNEYRCTCHHCDPDAEKERLKRGRGQDGRVKFAIDKWNEQRERAKKKKSGKESSKEGQGA